MRKLGSKTVTGGSGRQYVFDVYPLRAKFKPAPGVFLVSHRQLQADGAFSYTTLYVGQSADLSRGFDDHQEPRCYFRGTANCKSVLREPNKGRRLQIKSDILSGLAHPLNSETTPADGRVSGFDEKARD